MKISGANRVQLATEFSRQMNPNPFRISQAQHQSPSVEVVRDCHRDLIIARFQRQREGAILQRTSRVGKFSRSFLLK
jgi:hypothetical protein